MKRNLQCTLILPASKCCVEIVYNEYVKSVLKVGIEIKTLTALFYIVKKGEQTGKSSKFLDASMLA